MIRKALFFNGKKGFCPPQMGEPGGVKTIEGRFSKRYPHQPQGDRSCYI